MSNSNSCYMPQLVRAIIDLPCFVWYPAFLLFDLLIFSGGIFVVPIADE